MRFLGLACPGGPQLSALEDLVAVWRIRATERFQNYRALFTILREEIVQKDWLEDLIAGVSAIESPSCPRTWKVWASSGLYTPLQCSRQLRPRTKKDQLPGNSREWNVLNRVYSDFTDREFEFAAAELIRLMDERFVESIVTRAVRDGGRDVVSSYRVGHDLHQVNLSAYVEAKRWNPASAVGVKPMMRLIARLKHRDIGVFITTSFFDPQVQFELIEDRHPILLMSGGDVARLLISRELAEDRKLDAWIGQIRARAVPSVFKGTGYADTRRR